MGRGQLRKLFRNFNLRLYLSSSVLSSAAHTITPSFNHSIHQPTSSTRTFLQTPLRASTLASPHVGQSLFAIKEQTDSQSPLSLTLILHHYLKANEPSSNIGDTTSPHRHPRTPPPPPISCLVCSTLPYPIDLTIESASESRY